MYRKFALCAALSIFLTVALLMWRMCDRDGSVIFLQQQRSADWILYPKPVVPYRQAVAELPAEFRRDFRLERVPGTAKLSVRACKRFLVSINGKAVQVHTPAVGWKQPQTLEVASYLRAGENTISILVFNDVAPPALWAALVGDGLSLNTDGSWQVSYAGAVWRPARLASKPPPAKAGNPLFGGEDSLVSLRNQWPVLCVLVLVAAVSVLVGGRWLARLGAPASIATHSLADEDAGAPGPGLDPRIETAVIGQSRRAERGHSCPQQLASREPSPSLSHAGVRQLLRTGMSALRRCRHAITDRLQTASLSPLLMRPLVRRWQWTADPASVLLAAIILLWVALTSHNLGLMPAGAGFDTDGHIEYIQHILKRGTLPLADEGWEMHQPPLYYLVCAAVLKCAGLAATSFDGVVALRLLSLAISAVQLFFVFRSLRLLFPNQLPSQIVGLVLAGFLPMQIYLMQYVTNETLLACLIAATLYAVLRLFQSEGASWGGFMAAGIFLGLALLTKETAWILVPFVAGALMWRTLRGALPEPRDSDVPEQQLPKPDAKQWLPLLAALAACVLVCGWHYWRVWRHFGQPLFPETRWAYGKAWWQDPGYQTAAYFGRFGCALARPFFSGLYSFWDGMYSTLWGDGLCGGAGVLASRPPWNYELMALGCVLALLPTALIAVGLVSAVRGILRQFDCAWLILIGFGFAMALAIVHLNLVVPSYAEAKAIFGLSAILAVCACAARGWHSVDKLPKVMRLGVMIGLGVWALVAYSSFWIRGGSAATQAVLGRGLMRQGNYNGAIAHLELALRQDPLCPQARSWLVAILLDQGGASNAAPLAAEAVLKGPPRASYQMDLSKVLEAQARFDDALDHARRAVELAPDDPDARLRCATLAFRLGHFAEAIGFCREALRLSPTDPELHFVLGYSLVNAAKQPGVPLALGGGESLLPETAHDLSINELLTVQAMIHFRYVIRLSPDSPDALNNLAWLLATHPRRELRNGMEAVGLAQRACELTDYSKPDMLGTLAAAYAETGQFPLALEIAQKAEKLSQSSGDRSMQDRHKQFIGLFHDHQPVRMELPGGGHG